MAHEVTAWKEEDCTISISADKITPRETYSREINEHFGEGGGLNANYKTVEAACAIVNSLGIHGLRYGVEGDPITAHFRFKTIDDNEVVFEFANKEVMSAAQHILRNML